LVWSCWRLNCGSPEATTVGSVTAKRNADRPPLGSVESCSVLITPPPVAFDVSMSGAAPVTVMVSCERADFERDVERDELLRRDPEFRVLVGPEPGQRRAHRVGARGHGREVVLPCSFETASRLAPVPSLINWSR
jgi:hypothetical protein